MFKREKSGRSNGIADAGNFELAEDELLQLIEHSGFLLPKPCPIYLPQGAIESGKGGAQRA